MKTWLIWTLVAVAIIVVVYFLMKAKDKTVVKTDGTVVNGLGGRARTAGSGNKNIGGMNCTPVYNLQSDGTQWLASPPRWACPNGGIFDKNGNLTN